MQKDFSDLTIRIVLSVTALLGFVPGITSIGCVPEVVPENGIIEQLPDPVPTVFQLADTSQGILGGVDYADGRFLSILGEINDDGSPNVQSLALTDNEDNLFEMYFNEQHLPIQIRENGEIWDISYDTSDPSNISSATITHDGQSVAIELMPEFNELLQMMTTSARPVAASGREFNATTMLGVVMVGLAVVTCAGIPAAAASGLAALHVTVLGAVGSAAGGVMTIQQSLSDEPPTPEEQRRALIYDVIGVVGGATAVKAIIVGTAGLADVAGALSIVATYAGQGANSSPIQETIDDALEDAQDEIHEDIQDTSDNQISASMSGDSNLYINETGTYQLSISPEVVNDVKVYWSTIGVPVTLSSKEGLTTTVTGQQAGIVSLFADVFHKDSPTLRLATSTKVLGIVDPNEVSEGGGSSSYSAFENYSWKNSDGQTYYHWKDNQPAPQFSVSGDTDNMLIYWTGVDLCSLEVRVSSYPYSGEWGICTPCLNFDCSKCPLTSPVTYGTFPAGTVNMHYFESPPPIYKYDSKGDLIYYTAIGVYDATLNAQKSIELRFTVK